MLLCEYLDGTRSSDLSFVFSFLWLADTKGFHVRWLFARLGSVTDVFQASAGYLPRTM